MPTQITSIDPSYTYCIPSFFTAFDPPSTLVPASAMVPEPTASQVASGIVASSSYTPLGIAGKKTTLWNEPRSTTDALPSATSSDHLKAPGLDPQKTQPFGRQDHPTLAPHEDDPTSLVGTMDQQSSVTRDANPVLQASIISEAKETDPAAWDGDPEHATPDQMSYIASALADSPQNGPLVKPDIEPSGSQPSIPVQSQLILGGKRLVIAWPQSSINLPRTFLGAAF